MLFQLQSTVLKHKVLFTFLLVVICIRSHSPCESLAASIIFLIEWLHITLVSPRGTSVSVCSLHLTLLPYSALAFCTTIDPSLPE